jgi:RNA polymerase sigma factor (sigma-70 family)
MDAASDSELLRRSPDPDAVEAFYRRHVDTVMRFAVRRCATPDDVADLVSVTFLEAIGAARSYDARRGPARPWLLGIAARCLADHLRDRYRREDALRRLGARPAFTPDEAERVEGMIDAARLAAPLARGLRQLTDAERELLLLVAEEGLPVVEAGRALGIPAAAARMRLSRARRKLQPFLTTTATWRPAS